MGADIPDFDSKKNDYLQISLEVVESVENCCVVKLDGFVDTYNSEFFQEQLDKVIGAGYIKLVFDCEGLSYVSSTGIGAFINIWKSVKQKNGEYIFMKIQPKVYDVFQILGFANSFAFENSIGEVVEHFKK